MSEDKEKQIADAKAKAKAAAAAKAKAAAMKKLKEKEAEEQSEAKAEAEAPSDDAKAKAKAAAAAKAKAAAMKKLKEKEAEEQGGSETEAPTADAKAKAAAAAKAKAAAAAKAKAAAAAKAKAQGADTNADSDDEKAKAKAKAIAAAKAKAAAAAKAKAAGTSGAAATDDDKAKAKAAAIAKAKAAAAAKAKGGSDAKVVEPKEEKPSPNQPLLDRYIKVIKENLGEEVLEDAFINRLAKDVPTLVIKSESYFKVAQFLKHNELLSFDYVSEHHSSDFETHIEIYNHLYSFKTKENIAFKTKIDRDNPVIESIATIWEGANWPERESYDLLGVNYTGHPNLTRIMLSDDWVGHPLRKDYVQHDEEV